MKIAICFLLVALSSGFAAGAGSGLSSCKRKMTRTEAEVLACMVIIDIKKYASLQSKGFFKPGEKKCLIASAGRVLDLAAGITGCSKSFVFKIVSSCLKISKENKEILEAALVYGDFSNAEKFNADPKALMEAVCCAVKELITRHGHDATECFKGAMSGLHGLLGGLTGTVMGMLDSVLGNTLGVLGGVTGALTGALTAALSGSKGGLLGG
ncbi:uncharacterized protein RB166_008280 [Leptodactylus fuscus]|uniref:uncharacterized protein LOC142205085 n=1 Tax=Leptodactylus fuscus TaxID=238119 RepID=UPI003F4E4B1D